MDFAARNQRSGTGGDSCGKTRISLKQEGTVNATTGINLPYSNSGRSVAFSHVVMPIRSLLPVLVATACLAFTASAQQQYTLLDETFPSGDKASLQVAVGDADIHVDTDAESGIRVTVLVVAPSEDLAKRYFEAQRFDVALRDGQVHVLTEPNDGWQNPLRRPIEVQIQIEAPRSTDMRLRTSDGDVVVGNVDGDVMVRTSDGDIAAGVLTGTSFEARTSDGDVAVAAVKYKDVLVRSSDGDIELGSASAEEVTVSTSDGDIHIGELSATSDIHTSDGSVMIGRLISDSSQIRTSDGDILCGSVDGGLAARTSDGNIEARLENPGTVTLKTTDGDIDIEFSSSLAATLDLTATDILMMNCCESFVGTWSWEGHHAEGTLNGGGMRLQAVASDGSVRVRNF